MLMVDGKHAPADKAFGQAGRARLDVASEVVDHGFASVLAFGLDLDEPAVVAHGHQQVSYVSECSRLLVEVDYVDSGCAQPCNRADQPVTGPVERAVAERLGRFPSSIGLGGAASSRACLIVEQTP